MVYTWGVDETNEQRGGGGTECCGNKRHYRNGTMAKTDGPKYGQKNLSMTLDGDDIVIRIDSKGISHGKDGSECLAGSPNPTKDNPSKTRSVDLVSTSSGFKGIGPCSVSVNVTR